MLNNYPVSKKILRHHILADVLKAVEEDVGTGDITGLLIPKETEVQAKILTREAMVFCGKLWAEEVFYMINPMLSIQWYYQEGENVEANATICHIKGNARDILCAERTALNFIQTLSGVATQTQHYVKKLSGLKTILLDTRKTLPGLRQAEKYAVTCGGAQNHRYGLYDAFLIKENHIMACGSITEAIQKARSLYPEKKLEIEVETLNELQEAIVASPDVIMLDNFDLKKTHHAMIMRAEMNAEKIIKFEISGNITLDNIREIAETGVDYISTGAITKHIRAIDLTLLLADVFE